MPELVPRFCYVINLAQALRQVKMLSGEKGITLIRWLSSR
jgi:hypothetical protein